MRLARRRNQPSFDDAMFALLAASSKKLVSAGISEDEAATMVAETMLQATDSVAPSVVATVRRRAPRMHRARKRRYRDFKRVLKVYWGEPLDRYLEICVAVEEVGRRFYGRLEMETSQGIDAGKKIKGRKRHIATDVLGLLLAVIVTAASMQDSLGGEQLLDQIADTHPSVSTVWVDGGYNNKVIHHGAQQGIRVEVVKRPTTKGFHVLPRRWIVERTLGWLMQNRRLVRDYEALPQRSRTMIHWAMANKMSRELTGESTQTWRHQLPKPDITT